MIAMHSKANLCISWYLITFLGLIAANSLQVSPDASIQSPLPGEAVQGLVQIKGSTLFDDFSSYELAFSFGNDETETWFLISQSTIEVDNDILGEWDTSVLSDGDYSLRLIIHRIETTPVVILIEGIRVRNYSPIETDTPSEVLITNSPTLVDTTPTSQAPTKTQLPLESPTALPKNPAEITPDNITSSIQRGVIYTLIFLISLGLYVVYQSRK
ncbi:MAG: hypothetical protein PVF83_17570 [Anaerolineales bacterium]|jgi:hypothetical protein